MSNILLLMIYKITPVSFYNRVKKGMNVVEAITTPVRKKGGENEK